MLNQHQALGQHLTINPKQIAQLAIFQLDTLGLEQRIECELEDNPFLEETDHAIEEERNRSVNEAIEECQSWEDFYDNNYVEQYPHFAGANGFDEQWYIPRDSIAGDYRYDLKQQLKYTNLTPSYHELACFILDSCNDKGYLEQDIIALADEFSFINACNITDLDVRHVISHIQHLDPFGVAATDILEYYILQVSQKGAQNAPPGTMYILSHHFTDLQKGRWKEINEAIAKEKFCLADILHFLSGLRKAPVDTGTTSPAYVIPDFILSFDGNDLKVNLYRSATSSIRISSSYPESYGSQKERNQKEKSYLRQQYMHAQWFVESLRLREKNLLQIMHHIVRLQEAYFWSGSAIDIKPMLMKDIAGKTGIDISAVSRLISSKYMVTPFGTVSLRSLFSEGVRTTTGEARNSAVLELTIKDIVAREDKEQPFTDEQITRLLCEQGYVIARRTVSKYRERIGLPGCKTRRQAAWGSIRAH